MSPYSHFSVLLLIKDLILWLQYIYLVLLILLFPAQTTLVAPVWASPVRAVMEAPSPLGLFIVQPPPVYRHLELIFSKPYSRYIGWVEKIQYLTTAVKTSSFRSIIDNKQCGERPGNPCGSGRPTCQCPDGQSFRLDGGDDNVDYYDDEGVDDGDGVCCSDLIHAFVLHFIRTIKKCVSCVKKCNRIVLYLISAPVSWGPCWGSLLKDNFQTTDRQAQLFQVFLLQSCTTI